MKIAVLVVEDEPLVRLDIVAERGSWIIGARSRQRAEAIAILGDNPVVNVIFTDVDMPGGIDGLQLARIVKERFPPIQVVVTSGHRMVTERDLPVEAKFIPKSYVSKQIIRTILQIAGNHEWRVGMNTSLQLEGLMMAVAAVNQALVAKGLLTTEDSTTRWPSANRRRWGRTG